MMLSLIKSKTPKFRRNSESLPKTEKSTFSVKLISTPSLSSRSLSKKGLHLAYEPPHSDVDNNDCESSKKAIIDQFSGFRRPPRLGVGGGLQTGQSSFLQLNSDQDDLSTMSEAETCSTGNNVRFNHTFKHSHSSKVHRINGGPSNVHRRRSQSTLPAPPLATIIDEDAGIMSEVETSSTSRVKRSIPKVRNAIPMGSLTLNRLSNKSFSGFDSNSYRLQHRRLDSDDDMSDSISLRNSSLFSISSSIKGKDKPNLPVVRTPSKTLEKPLGLVFLVYRGETRRELFPNEVTLLDTVKAIFVRSFGNGLTMEYMESPRVHIYIHDNLKDIFEKLKNLSDVKDRTILKLFEADGSGRGPCGLGPTGLPSITNSDEVSDSQTQMRKNIKNWTSTLPRNTFSNVSSLNKSNSNSLTVDTNPLIVSPVYDSDVSQRSNSSCDNARTKYLGERNKTLGPGFLRTNDQLGIFKDKSKSLLRGQTMFDRTIPSRFSLSTIKDNGLGSTEEAKSRMMDMETQLSQLTGMVEKALKQKKLNGKKSVSFEKSVTVNEQPNQLILDTRIDPEMYNNFRCLQKSAGELRQEVLRRLMQLQSMAMNDLVQDTYLKLREACIVYSVTSNSDGKAPLSIEDWRLAQDKQMFSRDMAELLANISHLEKRVEEMRNEVLNKQNKIILQNVESAALLLNKSGKTMARLKSVSGGSVSAPEELESACLRCKKLTSTLVTLKRLASIQEQRSYPGSSIEIISISPTPEENKNVEQDLLCELEGSFNKSTAPPFVTQVNGSDFSLDSNSDLPPPIKKPPIFPPPRKPIPPPPPPRTSSTKLSNSIQVKESPLISRKSLVPEEHNRQNFLEMRHKELLARQKQLQQQYQSLQAMQEAKLANNKPDVNEQTIDIKTTSENTTNSMPEN